jgi:aminoglycoside 3-N-acetyltransferase
LEYGFGENSPLARLYEAHGHVLLLGVGHDRNSSLHLAEQRSDWPRKRTFEQGTAMLVDGKRTWVRFKELMSEAEDFERMGAGFDAAGGSRVAKVGSATAKLMGQAALVDFGVQWIREYRR